MAGFAIAPPRPAALAVAGSQALFPVGRVFCIGRNDRWRADEPAPQAMPAWCMKPATAVVPAAGVIPHPPDTRDFCHEIELVVAIGQGGRDTEPAAVESQHIWGDAAGLDVNRSDRQRADLAGPLWPVPGLVAMLSRSVALLPGVLVVAGIGELAMTVGPAGP